MRILIDGIALECSIGNNGTTGYVRNVNPATLGLAPGPGISGAIHAKPGRPLPGVHPPCSPQARQGSDHLGLSIAQ